MGLARYARCQDVTEGREMACAHGCWQAAPLTTAGPGERESLVGRLTTRAVHQPHLARRAQRLADRTAAQRSQVVVLGELRRDGSMLAKSLIDWQSRATAWFDSRTTARRYLAQGTGPVG